MLISWGSSSWELVFEYILSGLLYSNSVFIWAFNLEWLFIVLYCVCVMWMLCRSCESVWVKLVVNELSHWEFITLFSLIHLCFLLFLLNIQLKCWCFERYLIVTDPTLTNVDKTVWQWRLVVGLNCNYNVIYLKIKLHLGLPYSSPGKPRFESGLGTFTPSFSPF